MCRQDSNKFRVSPFSPHSQQQQDAATAMMIDDVVVLTISTPHIIAIPPILFVFFARASVP
jgi:hypothetical protein